MTTDLEKAINSARLWGFSLMGMTLGIWDMVEESAASLSPQIGSQLLSMLEAQFHFKPAGETPEVLLTELGQIFVNEFAFASKVELECMDKTLRVLFTKAVGTAEFNLMKERGVEKLFSHPFLCVGIAALSRLGYKARGSVDVDPVAQATTVSFELL